MILIPAAVIDGRDSSELLLELMQRLPGFTPDWNPGLTDPGVALARIFSRYAQAVIDRLDQAPGKNKLAFLDMMGISLASAGAARAVLVFQPVDGSAGGAAAAS